MNDCKHKFIKFDEDRIFCEKCGVFYLAARYAPTYVPGWTYRPAPYWYPPVTSPRPYITVYGTTTTAQPIPSLTGNNS